MLDYLGLILIIVGWGFQVWHIKRGSKELCPKFLKLYIIGALLLVIDGFAGGLLGMPILNLIALIAAGKALYFIRGGTCCCCGKPAKVKTVAKVKSVKKKRKKKK